MIYLPLGNNLPYSTLEKIGMVNKKFAHLVGNPIFWYHENFA